MPGNGLETARSHRAQTLEPSFELRPTRSVTARRSRPKRLAIATRDPDRVDPVPAGKSQIRNDSSQLLGSRKLVVIAHRRRGIHNHSYWELLLGLKKADHHDAETSSQIVVDPPEVIARHILAVVGEVDTVTQLE
jgi:hypothetical protein